MRDAEPTVSVLLPVYNDEPFLRAALDSVLTQTWTDFELIAVDDGSTDGSSEILAEAARRDPRVRVQHRPNGGIISALNDAIGVARGRYLARMDGDDLSEPTRFARQVEFLDAHPEVVAVGATYRLLGTMTGDVVMPRSASQCRDRLLIATPVAHGAAMIRRDSLQDNNIRYRPEFRHAEDFRLFSELAAVGELANLPDVLYRVRVHPAQISSTAEVQQRRCHLRIVRDNLLARGRSAEQADRMIARLRKVLWGPPSPGPRALLGYLASAGPAGVALLLAPVPLSVRRFVLRTMKENILLAIIGATASPEPSRSAQPGAAAAQR